MKSSTLSFKILAITILVVTLQGCSNNSPTDSTKRLIDLELPETILDEDVAFVNINVIPMDTESILENQTVIVRGGIIATIGPVESVVIPDSIIIVDTKGKAYLMPGLADMHVHMSGSLTAIRNDHILYIANGVTTIREMWGSHSDVSVSEQDAIAAGEVLGPTIYAASPGMDGPGGPWAVFTPPVSRVSQAQSLVRVYAARGYDFIKVYNLLSPVVYQAIVSEAKLLGIPVVGHVPGAVGIEAVFAAGQRSLEHLIGIKLLASRPFTGGTLDMDKVSELAVKAKIAGSWHTPTNAVNSLSVNETASIRNSPQFKYISPGLRQRFINGFHQGLSPSVASEEDANQKRIAKTLFDVGVELLVGSDSGFGYMLPGFALHDELQSFIEMGLTPYQTLRAATVVAAAFAGAESEFGAIKEGLRADLILLAGNPLDDFDYIKKHRLGVMVRGNWYSQLKLNRMLEEIADSY